MRETIVMCVGMALGIWTASSPATTTITGQVVDHRARPVAEAEVAVVENGLDWNTQLQDARVCAPIVRTDDRGEFKVAAQIDQSRNAFVVVRKPGLALAWDKAPMDAAGAPNLRFHVVLEKPARISGRVVDTSGRPVVGATVRAVPKTCYLSTLSQSPISLPEPWLSTRTDAEGRFQFEIFSLDVLCGFWVRASSRNCVYTFTPNYLSGCGYEVGRSDIRLVLPAEHRLRGRVVEQGTDKPVAGVDLQIACPADRKEDIKDQYLAYRVHSDANGVFVFPGVPEGEHEIELAYPEHGLPVWIVPTTRILVAADPAPRDLTVEAVPGGIVEILVRDARTRAPLPGIRVSLPNVPVSRLPFTDSNGVARACLQPGESRALISSGIGRSREYQSWGLRGTNERFFVIRSETIRLEVDLEPAHKIRGTVVDPNGNAVPGATVKIHPLTTGSPIISNIGDTLRTDASGRFELPCGEAEPVGWYVTGRHEERGWAGFAEVTGLDEPVRIKLRPGVTVRGTVTTPGGAGIPAARVAVLAHVGGTVSNVTAQTLCDADGGFSLQAVPPSDAAVTHRLCVDASGYGPKSYVEIEVSDRAGAVTDLGKIALVVADESLSGIVVDANDRPVAGIPIFLHGAAREVSQPPKTAATDENGRFRFDRICKGVVSLQANFRTSSQGWGGAKTEAGRQDVKIVLHPGEPGARIMSQVGGRSSVPQAALPYQSLMGKRLAELKDLEPLLPAGAGDKPLLIVFLDQQQRPSRGIVLELAKRMDLFKAKGIEIVAVQVAPLDRTALDRWLADQKVPFQAQILPDGFDKQRPAWGVQSLPWLILTDKGHTVVAEGFSLDDLDKRLQAAVDP